MLSILLYCIVYRCIRNLYFTWHPVPDRGLVCSTSSGRSQDRQLSSFPARWWHEAFHATFIHNIQRKGEDRIKWKRSKGTTISTTTSTYLPPLLCPQLFQSKSWGEEEPKKHIVTLWFMLIHISTSNLLKAVPAAWRALKIKIGNIDGWLWE